MVHDICKERFLGKFRMDAWCKRMWSFINKYDAHILSAYSTKDANSRKGKING